ncbi:MAG: VCBS repeat-containing protein [Planctomycetota bacterium]
MPAPLPLLLLACPAPDELFGDPVPLAPALLTVQGIATADIDGDGDTDLLVSSLLSWDVAWIENADGQGTFGPLHIIGAESRLSALAAADLDGDGDADVVGLDVWTQELPWFENLDGLGSFGAKQTIDVTSETAGTVHTADLDGDGDVDLLAALGGTVGWYENVGGASFAALSPIQSGLARVVCVAAADLDGDGDLDALAGGGENGDVGRLGWYANLDGAASFGPELLVAIPPDPVFEIAAADFDGDAAPDLLVRAGAAVLLHPNADGQGGFGPAEPVSTGPVSSTAVLDLDFDGDLDVLVDRNAVSEFDGVDWIENLDAMGSFAAELPLLDLPVGNIGTADVDGDGDQDLITQISSPGKLALHEHLEAGTLGPEIPVLLSHDAASELVAADLDGDARPDVVTQSPWNKSHGLAWYAWAEAAGSFVPRQDLERAEAVTTGDLDGDGDHDLISVRSDFTLYGWNENTDGLGTFGPRQELLLTSGIPAPPIPNSVVAADLDGDGDLDGAVTTFLDDTLRWIENADGLGAFGRVHFVEEELEGAAFVTAADFDADGDLDLAAASTGAGRIEWYRNRTGAGDFEGPLPVATGAELASAVQAADLDGDGDADLLAASSGDDTVAWFENTDGLGGFGTENAIATDADGARWVAAGDLDGDGDLDVLSASHWNDEVAWYPNLTGSGDFGAKHVLSDAVEEAQAVAVADLDGDGDLDALAASEGNFVALFGVGTVGAFLRFENTSCSASAAAAEVVRVGRPPNPSALLPAAGGPPVLGGTWDPRIEHAALLPGAVADFLGLSAAARNVPTPAGTLLCAPPSAALTFAGAPGAPFAVQVPADCVLIGQSLCAQGASAYAAGALVLTNALDLTVGTF